MGNEKGFCESLDRFKNLRRALVKGYGGNYRADCFFIDEDGIKPVKNTKRQFYRCVTKLLKAGMTGDELALFNYLNNR